MKLFFGFLCSCFLCTVLYAAPIISTAPDTLSNGTTITITGTGFGSKTSASPLISSYDNATSANNWSTGSLGANWHLRDAGDDPTLTTTDTRTNLTQSSYKATYNAAGAYSYVGYSHNSRVDKEYISWWTYNDYATYSISGVGENAKMLREYTDSTLGDGIIISNFNNSSTTTYDKTRIYAEHAPACSAWSVAYSATNATLRSSGYFDVNIADANCGNTMQQWVHWELYNTYSTNLEGGEDTSVLLKNGQTVARSINISLQTTDSDDDERFLLIGQVTGNRSEAQTEWLDQIYFDNTISHVILSASSSYSFPDNADVTHTETQVPTAWSDTSITFNVNQGTFGDTDTVYIYVVDASGACNSQGYEVTIGGSELTSGCSFSCTIK